MSSDPSEDKAAPSVGSAVLDQAFDGDSLYALRASVAAHAAEAGLSRQRVYDVLAAAHELPKPIQLRDAVRIVLVLATRRRRNITLLPTPSMRTCASAARNAATASARVPPCTISFASIGS